MASKDNTKIWDNIGRGTPAGRALFAIYNGDNAGKKVGNHFSTLNREVLGPNSNKRDTDTTPAWGSRSAIELKKAKAGVMATKKVNIPRVGKGGSGEGKSSSVMAAPINSSSLSNGRRGAAAIKRDLYEIERGIRIDAARPKDGPVFDEAEKEMLVMKMAWRSKPPPEIEALLKSKEKGAGKVSEHSHKSQSIDCITNLNTENKDSLAEAEMMFKSVLSEIQEREEFLEKMEVLGRKKQYEHTIQAEIGTRLGQLRKLDALINKEIKENSNCT